MFGSKKNNEMSKANEPTNGSINLIGNGTTIEGEIQSTGDVRTDGSVKGSVTSRAKAVIGTTGRVDGDINCQNADISGSIKGKIVVSELLFLKSTAKITGDIVTKKLVVEAGATFTGSCNMGGIVKDMKYNDEQSTEPKQRNGEQEQSKLARPEEKTA